MTHSSDTDARWERVEKVAETLATPIDITDFSYLMEGVDIALASATYETLKKLQDAVDEGEISAQTTEEFVYFSALHRLTVLRPALRALWVMFNAMLPEERVARDLSRLARQILSDDFFDYMGGLCPLLDYDGALARKTGRSQLVGRYLQELFTGLDPKDKTIDVAQ